MQSTSPPPRPPGSNYREIFALVCSMLPPSPDDTPDTRAARERGAMDAVTALNPYDAFEARLAARIVGMDAHAADSLRSAGLAAADPAEMHRCRAQAASMARQSDAALRSLLRMQATREKQLAALHPAAMERAGYWFREITVPEPAPDPVPPAEADPFSQLTEAEQLRRDLPGPCRAHPCGGRAAGGPGLRPARARTGPRRRPRRQPDPAGARPPAAQRHRGTGTSLRFRDNVSRNGTLRRW